MSASSLQVGSAAQYPGKKRRRPQPKKSKEAEKEEAKSNPSKRHRDRLNTQLDGLSQLIPFPDEVLNKLDKLSILRLAVSYLKNKNYHHADPGGSHDIVDSYRQLVVPNQHKEVACFSEPESTLSLTALHGFLIVVTQDFNIFYVTETVLDYLGFPQSDVMNLSMLDLVHAEDRETFMRHMQLNPQQTPPAPPDEADPPKMPEYANNGMSEEVFRQFSQDGLFHRSFICRVRCLLDNSSGFLALHFTGHLRIVPGQNKRNESKMLLSPEVGLFLLASPLQSPGILEIRTKNLIFRTKHELDYTPLGIDARGRTVLGYNEKQLRERSGYEFIHSADMMHCADAHTKLMRQGESGLTVFRLLHKDNTWVWVTASARLIYKGDVPDCIVATQRPILDQEGEEHMKKRTHAFRFDFTGQAILYGKVNPIGTQGGPENNPLDSGPAHKRQRMSKDVVMQQQNGIDRKTLYGAQSMQRMDIYVGNLPNQSSDFYEHCGVTASAGAVEELLFNDQIQNDTGPLTNDSDTYFYPMGTDVPTVQQTGPPIMDQDFSPNNGRQLSVQQAPTMMNEDGAFYPNNPTTISHNYEGNGMSPLEPPRLHHPPNTVESMSATEHRSFQQQQQQQQHHHQQQQQQQLVNNQSNPLKRSYNSSVGKGIGNQNAQNWHQTQSLQKQHATAGSQINLGQHSMNTTLPPQNTMLSDQNVIPGFSNDIDMPHSTMRMQERTHQIRFLKPNDDLALQEIESAKVNQQQADMNRYAQPMQHFNANNEQHQNSVIDSMTIRSRIAEGKQFNSMMPSLRGSTHNKSAQFDFNNQSVSSQGNWDRIGVVELQDNNIQFDLDKIAADYQTTDPMSKVEDYLKEHPAEAMAIATGFMPGENMPKLAPEKVNAFMTSCQFSQQPAMDNSWQQQYPKSSTSAGIGKNMMNHTFMNQPQADFLDDMSFSLSSVSSSKSMATASPADSSNIESPLTLTGNLFQSPESYQ